MTLADQAAMSGHDGQVSSGKPGRPKRRAFTAAYKARILAEYDALPDGSPERGALMRRERLYHSHIEHWRTQQEKGTLPATTGKPPARSAEAGEIAQLRAENKKLKARNGRLENRGKSICAAGGHLRQRGLRRELNQVIDAHFPAMEKAVGAVAACAVLGKIRSTLHRQRHPRPAAASRERKEFRHPAELGAEEKERVLRELNSPRFADKSVAQAHTVLLDEGCYLCSQATMHRLLREHGASGERRAQAVHPARKEPELLATGPSQVWSWDITKLKGPARGTWYLLYVIMDIYSRKAVHWEIWPTETGILAREFIEHAIAANNGIVPESVHADRGTSMTSNTVAGLYAKLNITQSHSRPHVSNDNPYSESAFKTLKYCPAFPGEFGSIQDATVFCGAFFTYYNNEHRHSGIAMHTPASVHDGSWAHVQARRAATLQAAYAAHPERFRGRCPQPKNLPGKVWINEPPATIETSPPLQTTQSA